MTSKFPELWNRMIKLSQFIGQDFGAMADYSLHYNPYAAKWVAKTSWSSSRKVEGWGDAEDEAVTQVIEKLQMVASGELEEPRRATALAM